MENLSEDLKNNLYYIDILDALMDEHGMELKNRLQRGDNYTQYIREQSQALMDKTIGLVKENGISFLEASNMVIEDWQDRTFK